MTPTYDEAFMMDAILCAEQALQRGERPFGCVILLGQEVIARAGGTGTLDDPTRHSEMVAIRSACAYVGGRLNGCTLYSTHEPCAMCAGAIAHAKLDKVVFGSRRSDLPGLFTPRTRYDSTGIMEDCSRPIEVKGGVCRVDCIRLFRGALRL